MYTHTIHKMNTILPIHFIHPSNNTNDESEREAPDFLITFSDKKKNIIIDGVFAKITYSNSYFTMNGLYIHFHIYSKYFMTIPERGTSIGMEGFSKETTEEFRRKNIETHERKCLNDGAFAKHTSYITQTPADTPHTNYIQFDPTLYNNQSEITSICDIERHILHLYSATIRGVKTPTYCLQTQLCIGFIKIHTRGITLTSEPYRRPTVSQYIKISGVWETAQTYGITYKVFC
jgi:hypothetical protein